MRFGTDGIRGVAGSELSPELVLALGRAAAQALLASDPGGSPAPKGTFFVGRDTRLSGPALQAALSAGLAAEGADVVDLGVVPTPVVAALAAREGAPAAMVSASHNPFSDNGVKLFAPGGRKLDDHQEAEIEGLLSRGSFEPVQGERMGRLRVDTGSIDWYCETVLALLGGRTLEGIRVVADCANGAATTTAPRILRSAGAEVVELIGVSPDGVNINDGCGSTYPSLVASAVERHRADVGLAFDGDADRVIAVDGTGELVDGDCLLALFARDLKDQGRLAGDTLVVTVMSNLGLLRAMEAAGISVHQTPVGDRYVLEALDSNGWVLGGEQSGHLIFRDSATTGDGVMSGLLLLDLVVRSGRSLAELGSAAMKRLPQVLRNVRVGAPATDVAGSQAVVAELKSVEQELGRDGRVLVRASGTEPLVRIMVEAPRVAAAEAAVERLAAAVRAAGSG